MIIIGIILGLISYASLNIGMVLQKKGANSLQKIENETLIGNLKNFLTCKIWVLGFILISLPFFLLIAALSFTPLTLVFPLMGFGLIILSIFSKFYLKEEISNMEYYGIAITIAGIFLLTFFSNLSNIQTFTIGEIWNLIFSPISFIIILIILGISIFLYVYTITHNYYKASIIMGALSGISAGLGAIFSKGVATAFSPLDISVILSKILNLFWIILLLIVLFANLASTILNQVGFQKGKAIQVVPLYSVIGIVLPILFGIFILNEWEGQLIPNMILQIFGIIIIIIGIVILSYYSEKKKEKIDT